MFTLYGVDLSFNVTKVKFAANAMNLQYEFKNVNLLAGEQRTPEFLKINPVGRVPAIDDNGFKLFESNAIIRYLADANNSPLFPKDAKKRAVIDQWMDFASIHVATAMARLFFNTVIYKMMNVPKDEQSYADGLKFLGQFLPIVEKQLTQNQYMAGNEFSLADISMLASLEQSEVVSFDLSNYPKIVEWRNGLMSQGWYQKIHKNAGETLQKIMAGA